MENSLTNSQFYPSSNVLDQTVKYRPNFGPVVLFRIGGVSFVTFGLLVGLGAFIALMHTWFFLGATGSAGMADHLNTFALTLAFGAPFAAYVITRLIDLPVWLRGQKSFGEYIRTVSFGLWGGLLGGTAIVLAFSISLGLAPLRFFDAMVLGLPLAQAIGRLGCLNYGCCHGRIHPNSHGFTQRYYDPNTKVLRFNPELRGKSLYPTQIWSFMANIMIYGLIMGLALGWPERPLGTLAGAYMLAYGIKRFWIEFYRGEYPRIHLAGLTLWQWLSLLFALAGILILGVASTSTTASTTMEWSGGWVLLAQSWPLLLLAALVMSLAYGIHGRKLGAW